MPVSALNREVFSDFVTIQQSLKGNSCIDNYCQYNKNMLQKKSNENTADVGQNSQQDVFKQEDEGKNTYKENSSPQKLSILPLMTSIAGTAASIALIRKYQGVKMPEKGLFKKIKSLISYKTNLKEMLILGAGAIGGGLLGGIVSDFGKGTKEKIKESIFQFNNIAIPTVLVTGATKLVEESKYNKSLWAKAGATLAGLAVGLPAAMLVSNKINNTYIDKNSKNRRRLRLKDGLVHIDDIVTAATIGKFPFVEKLQIDKTLPVLYTLCGWEAGSKAGGEK